MRKDKLRDGKDVDAGNDTADKEWRGKKDGRERRGKGEWNKRKKGRKMT